MENINLNNYKYFYYVVKSQGYTNASNKIMVSQPSLSYGVKKLEEEIGKKLIDSSCKNFVLTKEGEMLFKKLKEVEKLLFNDDVKQKISIGSLRGLADTYLPQIVNIFHKRFPKCQLEIIINESRTLISLFDRNDINILFDKNELTTFNKDVENICLRKSENCFACSKKFYIENEKLLNDINRFPSWPLILPLESKKRRYLDEYFKLNGLVPTNVIMEIPNSNLIKEVIKNCDAVGYFMKESIQKEINAGELVVIDTIKKLPADDVYVIYNKDSNNRFISEFISVCKEYLQV
mgnify:FL=1